MVADPTVDVPEKNIHQNLKSLKFILVLITFGFFLFASGRPNGPYIVVLGTAQDGGLPHAGCRKICCETAWNNPNKKKRVASLGIVDPVSGKSWMIDATPDFPEQLTALTDDHRSNLEGIFLTHAHIGHYTGLIHLGREVMGSANIDVFAMPRMSRFLTNNGPWNQLVELNNITLQPLRNRHSVTLADNLSIEPVQVPHRDEFSETVGFRIYGQKHALLYIPDIDKWTKWEMNIVTEISKNSFVLIDGTFFAGNEIPNRDMSEIPHPFIVESMNILDHLSETEKNKIHFIHLNHSNPLHDPESPEAGSVRNSGFSISREGQIFPL
jgi:pyrroloquinoline quinone biosynthesis protein B